MRRLPGATYVVLTMVAGLAGCADAQPASAPAAPPVIDLATRSGTWPATQEVLEAAASRLTRQCLNANGFAYPEVPRTAMPRPEDEAAAIDLSTRRRWGYGLTRDSEPTTGSQPDGQPSESYYNALSPAERARFDVAMFGPPDQATRVEVGGDASVLVRRAGCVADSRRVLAGDVAVWARMNYAAERYSNDLADRVAGTPGYRTALVSWQECMRDRGHGYESPEAAYQAMQLAVQASGATTGARTREIAVAVADGECAGQAHLPTAALRARRDLAASLPAADRRTLESLASQREAAVRRASDVLDRTRTG